MKESYDLYFLKFGINWMHKLKKKNGFDSIDQHRLIKN